VDVRRAPYLDNLLGLLDNEKGITDFAAYTDDLCILISGNSHREQETKAYTAVRTIHDWCQKYKMTISPTKTLAIVFGKTLKRKPIIKLGTTTLPVKEDTRYLGTLDQKLNFSKHINVSLEKAKAQLNKILTLADRKYNIHPRKFKVYYNAISLSIATYAIQIFADKYKKVRNRRKALTVQGTVLRRMYRAYKTTPVESLQIVTDTPPLDLQMAIRAMKIQQDTDLTSTTRYYREEN